MSYDKEALFKFSDTLLLKVKKKTSWSRRMALKVDCFEVIHLELTPRVDTISVTYD